MMKMMMMMKEKNRKYGAHIIVSEPQMTIMRSGFLLTAKHILCRYFFARLERRILFSSRISHFCSASFLPLIFIIIFFSLSSDTWYSVKHTVREGGGSIIPTVRTILRGAHKTDTRQDRIASTIKSRIHSKKRCNQLINIYDPLELKRPLKGGNRGKRGLPTNEHF